MVDDSADAKQLNVCSTVISQVAVNDLFAKQAQSNFSSIKSLFDEHFVDMNQFNMWQFQWRDRE